jgi:glycosyltransferase involved in cell wall biosynthesis
MIKPEPSIEYEEPANRGDSQARHNTKAEDFPRTSGAISARILEPPATKMKVLLLSSTTHPFVEELRNQLSKNKIRTTVVYLRGHRSVKLRLVRDAFLFLGRIYMKNRSMLFKLISIMFKSGFRIRFYLKFLNIFFMGIMIYRLHFQRCFDLIHAFWSYPAGVSAVLVKALTGTPVIISVLGYDVDEETLRNNFLRELSKFALDNADAVIVAVENHYLNLARMGVDRKKICFIPIGVDTTKFNANINGSFIRKKYGIANDVIVAFGPHLSDLYGPIDFLRAATIVSKEVSNVSFILLGDGPLSEYLKTLARNWGLKAVFTGHVPYLEMPFYYTAIDIFCTPSYAGQGVSTLEAMACGKPVVGYRVGTIRIMDGINGFLVPKGDVERLAEKLLILIRDPTLRKIMGENARKMILDKYDLNTNAQRIIKVYEKLLKRDNPHQENGGYNAAIA